MILHKSLDEVLNSSKIDILDKTKIDKKELISKAKENFSLVINCLRDIDHRFILILKVNSYLNSLVGNLKVPYNNIFYLT